MIMDLRTYLKDNLIFLDGGMGTLLQQKGLPMGELPERWNVTKPDVIKEIHKSYLQSGSNIICANTFGANLLKFEINKLKEIIFSAIKNAKDAISECDNKENKWVALDVGPLGKMLKPYGDLDFLNAVEIINSKSKVEVFLPSFITGEEFWWKRTIRPIDKIIMGAPVLSYEFLVFKTT